MVVVVLLAIGILPAAAQEAVQLRDVTGAIVNGTANSLPASASPSPSTVNGEHLRGVHHHDRHQGQLPLREHPPRSRGPLRRDRSLPGSRVRHRHRPSPRVHSAGHRQYLRDVRRPVAPLGVELLAADSPGRQDRPRRVRPGDRQRGKCKRPDLRPRRRTHESPPLRPAAGREGPPDRHLPRRGRRHPGRSWVRRPRQHPPRRARGHVRLPLRL